MNDIVDLRCGRCSSHGYYPAPKPGDVSIDVELPVDGSRDDKPGIDGDVAVIPGVKEDTE